MAKLSKEAIKAEFDEKGPHWLWCASLYAFIYIESIESKKVREKTQDQVVCWFLRHSAMDSEPKRIAGSLAALVSKEMYPLLRGSVFMGVLERDLRALLAGVSVGG
jgi:hypothetical protein